MEYECVFVRHADEISDLIPPRSRGGAHIARDQEKHCGDAVVLQYRKRNLVVVGVSVVERDHRVHTP